MPRRRLPRELWQEIRRQVWVRDQGLCQYPYGKHPVTLDECHVDHIVSGKLGSNELSNLRVLCRCHHVLRVDARHRGMLANALADGVIPVNWRELVWDEPPRYEEPEA